MSIKGQIVLAVVCVLTGLWVVHLAVRGRMSEKYCLWWLMVLAVAFAMVAFQPLVLAAARLVGAIYPASVLAMMGLLLLLMMAIKGSAESSALERRTLILTQELAILRHEVERLSQLLTQERPPESDAKRE